jgi:hypothetical protein
VAVLVLVLVLGGDEGWEGVRMGERERMREEFLV